MTVREVLRELLSNNTAFSIVNVTLTVQSVNA